MKSQERERKTGRKKIKTKRSRIPIAFMCEKLKVS